MTKGTLTAPEAVQEPADLQALMAQPAFRRFMSRLCASAGIMQPTHGPDARHSAFREGRRALVLEVLAKLQAAEPGALIRIWSEPITQPKEPQREKRDDDPYREIRDDDEQPGAA